ncbi:MAG TPA: hypothetical protein ENI37_04425 [Chloroflexi bacterium]|nr:hypothetical protein [Chloroflexota bacterium]
MGVGVTVGVGVGVPVVVGVGVWVGEAVYVGVAAGGRTKGRRSRPATPRTSSDATTTASQNSQRER